jgi:hypothetical protein
MLGSDRVPDAVCKCLSARKSDMDATQPRAVITHYFDLMGRGEDFAICYAEDVSWTTFDGGTVVSGPTEVRDYLTGLHRNMPEYKPGRSRTRMRLPTLRATAPIRAVRAPIGSRSASPTTSRMA